MPTEAVQQFLAAFEIGLLLIGLLLFLQIALNPSWRTRWLGTNKLPAWGVTLPEFLIYAFLFFVGGFILLSLSRLWLGEFISKSSHHAGLEIMIYGSGLHGGSLLGWLLFPTLRRRWYADYGSGPPAEPAPAPSLLWGKVLLYAFGTVTIGQMILTVVSVGWIEFLKQLGLPVNPQETIGIFAGASSPVVVAGMAVEACVLAPLAEELLFRAGLYRFCREHLGRGASLLISSILFGALHGNWAGFLPLATFGAILALAYEATGSLKVSIVAHALFNLTTILLVLSGLQS